MVSVSFWGVPFENLQIVTVLNGAFGAKNGGANKIKEKSEVILNL